MSRNILMLPGDGIGPEIVAEAEKVLNKVNEKFSLGLSFESALVGGAAIDEADTPLPEETLEKARAADAILLGAVGGPQWDSLPMAKRPEKGRVQGRRTTQGQRQAVTDQRKAFGEGAELPAETAADPHPVLGRRLQEVHAGIRHADELGKQGPAQTEPCPRNRKGAQALHGEDAILI